jgi:diguanylate cyclase (GGDEF)-like protein
MSPSPLQYEVFRFIAPVLAALLALEIALCLRKPYRSNPATRIFVIFAACTIGFLVVNTLEISSRTEAANQFWSRMLYVFIAFLPVIWLDFSLRLTADRRGLPLWALILLLTIPVATLVVIFSSRLAHLMWPSVSFMRVARFVIAVRVHGPWFRLYAVYTYGVCAAGVVVILKSFVFHHRYYRRRSLWVVLGILMPIAASVVYVAHPIPGLVKDYTAVGYALGVTFFFVVILGKDLFAIIPVARDLLVERLREGILVVDEDGRVKDANPAALQILGSDGSLIGRSVRGASLSPTLPPPLVDAAVEGKGGTFVVSGESGDRHYAVDAIALSSRRGLLGRLVVIRDETEVRGLLARLEALAREDALTGLPNRRAFMEAAASLVSLASRHGEALCAAMFDLDSFKAVNDANGHAVGDQVLQRFAEHLRAELRGSDVIGRIGGDEFAAILPRTAAEGARRVCERIRERFSAPGGPVDRGPRTTASIGVAELGAGHRSVEELLGAADAALYEAKAAGGDRVRTGVSEPGAAAQSS